MKLSERHREQFVDQGYAVVEGALTDGDLQPVIDDYSAIVADLAKKLHAEGRISRLHEEEPFDTRLARICDEDEETYFDSDEFLDIGQARPRGTFEFMRNGNLLDLVEGFVGPEISCNSISHIRAKLPSDQSRNRDSNIAGRHQDAIFTTPEARDLFVLTVWLPLTEATAGERLPAGRAAGAPKRDRVLGRVPPGIRGGDRADAEGGRDLHPQALPARLRAQRDRRHPLEHGPALPAAGHPLAETGVAGPGGEKPREPRGADCLRGVGRGLGRGAGEAPEEGGIPAAAGAGAVRRGDVPVDVVTA